MACCPNGIYIPLVMDCNGDIRTLQAGEQLRIGGTLYPPSIITITASVVLTSDTLVLADATAAALTVTLPPGIEGMRCGVKKIDLTGNVVTIDGYGSETIDNELDAAMGRSMTSLTFLFQNGEWWVL